MSENGSQANGRSGLEVESVRSGAKPGGRRSGERGGENGLTAPRLREDSHIPLQGPEVLDVVFRLGVLTADQAAQLVPSPVTPRRVRAMLAQMGADDSGATSQEGEKAPAKRTGAKGAREPALVRSARHPFRYSGSARPAGWRRIYYLSGEGLGYVARRRDLYPSKAESLYRGVLEEARVDHALLRNEFYRRLVAEVPRADTDGFDQDESLKVVTLWAEKGMNPIRLDPVEGKQRRFLNPDGLLELGDDTLSGARNLRVYVESDTGSQDMDWQVASHADKYAEHLWSLLEAESKAAGSGLQGSQAELPVVLFVSPGPGRSRWVRRKIRENGLNRESVFAAVLERFKEHNRSLPALFWFTNLAWLEENGGPRGPSYWPLSSAKFESLIGG